MGSRGARQIPKGAVGVRRVCGVLIGAAFALSLLVAASASAETVVVKSSGMGGWAGQTNAAESETENPKHIGNPNPYGTPVPYGYPYCSGSVDFAGGG